MATFRSGDVGNTTPLKQYYKHFYSAVQCSVPACRLAKYTASSIELTTKIHITYMFRNLG